MNPIKLKFLTERYEKENRDLKFQEEFIALPGLKPVSGKFYAKHDIFSHDAPEEYINIVKRSASVTPKQNYKFPPPCINMEYGWFSATLIPRTLDKRLAFPIRESDYIKTEIYIKEMQKKLEKNQKRN